MLITCCVRAARGPTSGPTWPTADVGVDVFYRVQHCYTMSVWCQGLQHLQSPHFDLRLALLQRRDALGLADSRDAAVQAAPRGLRDQLVPVSALLRQGREDAL